MDREELARALAQASYLEGDFLLASGKRSRYYFDKFLFETRPELLRPVADLLAAEVPPEARRLAGPELGAVPLATAAALATGLPFLIVRGEAKAYGTAKRIEGAFEDGDPVVLLEDVVTTGGSALTAAGALTDAGCRVLQVLAVVDREEGGCEAIARAGYPVVALFTRTELERGLYSEG